MQRKHVLLSHGMEKYKMAALEMHLLCMVSHQFVDMHL